MPPLSKLPELFKGGIVLIDPEQFSMQRVITMQYNPATVSRTLQIRGLSGGEEGGEMSEVLRLKGPAAETIKVDAEIDAIDQLEGEESMPGLMGIQPQLAVLEMAINPSISQVMESKKLEKSGFMEVLPMEAPLTLFIWSQYRIMPVRITEFSVTEEMFNANLYPLRAKVSLGMRVLTYDDLGFSHKGGALFMSHLKQKEIFSKMGPFGTTSELGIGGKL